MLKQLPICPDQSGRLECTSVVAKMGPHFTICCRAESPASMDDLPLWKFEERVDTFPTKDPVLSFSGQKATHVDEPDPLVDLSLGDSGPALTGESFILPVTVTSRGHDVYSGELKINLVDVKGGGLFSPRETEAFSLDSHHVELLSIVRPEGEGESQLVTNDIIDKIQQSFGLVSVPFLKNGDSWSCKLEIKWHRPKPIMLFVSLGYSPFSNEPTAQKVHVHKSLQIEGKTAVVISHQFMLPFRRDPLLPSRIKPASNSEQLPSLSANETSILIISAKNCTEVPLQLLSLSVDDVDSSVQHEGEDNLGPALLVPGKEFKKVFTITPSAVASKLKLGTVCLKWRRSSSSDSLNNSAETWVLTKHNLPEVAVEVSPLVVSLDYPPFAILGEPFTYLVKIQNQTDLLQEVKLILGDAQSMVLSGSHSDTVYILPQSHHTLTYQAVPLFSGSQQLPKVTVTSTRYSAGFQASSAASTVFIFPSKPEFKVADSGENTIQLIPSE